jgi:hypothetical protein
MDAIAIWAREYQQGNMANILVYRANIYLQFQFNKPVFLTPSPAVVHRYINFSFASVLYVYFTSTLHLYFTNIETQKDALSRILALERY